MSDRVLLVDGMGLLVRASKAASNMRERLHFGGTPTGTLLLFAQSLIRVLNDSYGSSYPTHVVVAWEGIPQQNWRYRYYADYRSSRAYPDTWERDDLGPLSDLELAQGFCRAAGLHQSWQSRFEGDDMIAAWWRLIRSAQPDASVVIATSDADLHQLCDRQTICVSVADGEVWTDVIVRDVHGVYPEDLAAMRALAGDPSDEIPGVRGVGVVKAASLVLHLGTPDLFSRMLESLFPEDAAERERIRAYYIVSYLREPAERPDQAWTYADVYPGMTWRPGEHYHDMHRFLERYGMARLARRLESGLLPWREASYDPG